MQLADGDARASEPSERAFLSPGKAFALLFGVILVLGGAIFLLRPDDLPRESVTYPAGGDAPTFELTDAEAITRFETLESLINQAFEERDASLLPSIYTTDSPVVGIASKEIRQLLHDDVVDHSTFETLEIQVLSNTADQIVLRQEVQIDSLFFTESGKDITERPRHSSQVVHWTLELENGQWKIHDSVIKESQVIR